MLELLQELRFLAHFLIPNLCFLSPKLRFLGPQLRFLVPKSCSLLEVRARFDMLFYSFNLLFHFFNLLLHSFNLLFQASYLIFRVSYLLVQIFNSVTHSPWQPNSMINRRWELDPRNTTPKPRADDLSIVLSGQKRLQLLIRYTPKLDLETIHKLPVNCLLAKSGSLTWILTAKQPHMVEWNNTSRAKNSMYAVDFQQGRRLISDSSETKTLKDEPTHGIEALNEAKQRLGTLETLKWQKSETKERSESSGKPATLRDIKSMQERDPREEIKK